jgi:glycyl-tRNA synthetase beta chain
MPDLLLELRSEEIPARMQRKAAGDLRKLLTDGLVEAGLTYEAAKEYWTPRRLTLDIRGLTARSKDVREERKGPSISAPQQAIDGFVRAAGLSSIAEAQIQSDPKKGEFYVAVISKPGRAASEIIAELVPKIIRSFSWPTSMRWGSASRNPGSLKWVRPLQSIVCMLGTEPEEPVLVEFDVDGIRSGNVTYGHRFHAPDAIIVKRFEDYAAKLEKAKVVLDAERRKEIILSDARNLCFAQGLELIEDEALLEEVSGLVEWPVVLMGEFEADYLSIPAEVIRLTIKTNQKCFVTRPSRRPSGPPQDEGGRAFDPHPEEPRSGVSKDEGQAPLSNRFILVANIEAKDHGAEIARGNGKVVRARLSDALYFWKTDQGNVPDLKDLEASAAKFGLDLTKPLDQRMARLDHLNVTFHTELGSQGRRVLEVVELSEFLAKNYVGSSMKSTRRAALLAKADLQTGIVGEFPELQGFIGSEYARRQGEKNAVSQAIGDHYRPQGPSDEVPREPISVTVSLADKIHLLVAFWSIGQTPTGSKDPYALRRAVLGVMRIILENALKLPLTNVFWEALNMRVKTEADEQEARLISSILESHETARGYISDMEVADTNEFVHLFDLLENIDNFDGLPIPAQRQVQAIVNAQLSHFWHVENQASWMHARNLLAFFHDRLKVYLRDQGARHDLIDAVITPDADDLLAIARRVEALTAFINTEDGKNLVAGYKRAANILAAEEKKGAVVDNVIDATLFASPEETALFEAVNQSSNLAGQAIEKEDYSGAMQALSALREPVDSFFEKVLVNDPDDKVRLNRLALLAEIRRATARVADFSKIAG